MYTTSTIKVKSNAKHPGIRKLVFEFDVKNE